MGGESISNLLINLRWRSLEVVEEDEEGDKGKLG